MALLARISRCGKRGDVSGDVKGVESELDVSAAATFTSRGCQFDAATPAASLVCNEDALASRKGACSAGVMATEGGACQFRLASLPRASTVSIRLGALRWLILSSCLLVICGSHGYAPVPPDASIQYSQHSLGAWVPAAQLSFQAEYPKCANFIASSS